MSVDESAETPTKPLDSIYLTRLLDNINVTQDHLVGNDGTPLFPSLLPPTAVWTAQEKDAFFHALSVCSRFRPDLMSHEIKTKSVQEVSNYLSILQLAASKQETTVPYLQWRQNLPIAVEVSSEWVAMEEEKAAGVITQEQDWQRELIIAQRRAEIKLLKRVSKAEHHGMGLGQRKAALTKQIADADLRARREDFCSSLGSTELTAIGTTLRGAPSSSGSNQIKQPSVLHTPTLQHSTAHVKGLEATQTLPFSDTNGAAETLNLNRPQCAFDEDGEPPPPTPPPKQDSMTLLAGLSPASRRRHQKRLYMRRKRASISGATTIDDSLERLKPGRKRVKRSPSPGDETQRGPEHSEDKEGTTRYPRAKQIAIDELRDLDLAADDLRRLGIDVLNPDGVAKMLHLWDKLSGDISGYGSRISIEAIQLLSAHVVWFVKNLVYRAITLREEERALKSETKVWKLSGKAVLTREHIEKAVSMTNHRELNKARFFESIIAEMNGDAESEGVGREFTESGPDVTLPSLHRDIYAPLVWITESEGDSEMTDHTNDEELDNELLEEEELDELDMVIEMNHESGLWDKAQRFQTPGPEAEVSIAKAGQRTTYKSMEFIEDSD